MRPQSCKAKGRRLQQLIVCDLLTRFSHLNDDDVRSTSMGAHGEDVQLSSAARRVIPYSFEAKNQERLNIWSAIEQSESNKPDGTHSVIVFKKNGQPAYAAVKWSNFLDLIAPANATKKQKTSTELELLAAKLSDIAAEIKASESTELSETHEETGEMSLV